MAVNSLVEAIYIVEVSTHSTLLKNLSFLDVFCNPLNPPHTNFYLALRREFSGKYVAAKSVPKLLHHKHEIQNRVPPS